MRPATAYRQALRVKQKTGAKLSVWTLHEASSTNDAYGKQILFAADYVFQLKQYHGRDGLKRYLRVIKARWVPIISADMRFEITTRGIVRVDEGDAEGL